VTDTGPATAAQKAAFGISDSLDRERYDYRPGAAASQDRIALDKAQAEQTRQRQLDAIEALTSAANGTVPSAAELQMRREAGRNVAATLGQARALGGRSAGGAARAGTLASADLLANTSVQPATILQLASERVGLRFKPGPPFTLMIDRQAYESGGPIRYLQNLLESLKI
jgi:hypothetical protein